MSPHVDLGHAADAWLRTLRAGQLSPRTLDAYRRTINDAIDIVGSDLDARALGIDEWECVIAAWAGLAPNTLHNRMMAIRSFDGWLHLRRGGKGEARHLAPIRRYQAEPRRLTDGEVIGIVEAAETPRDYAIAHLLAYCALRNHEIRALRVGDVDLDERMLLLPSGKGGHGRVVPLGDATVDALAGHLADLDAQGCADRRHYLVCRRRETLAGPSGYERREHLEPWKPAGHTAIGRLVTRLADDAGIVDAGAITPHMFRRWSLEAFLAETGDLHAAAELAGHRDVNQTRRYAGRAKIARVRSGVEAIEAAASRADRPTTDAKARRNPSDGRTWDRTRDSSAHHSQTVRDADPREVGE